jgi:hypothetical protein
LYRLADRVLVSGKPLYSHPKYPVYDASVFNHILLASAGTRELAWVNSAKLTAYPALNPEQRQNVLRAWGKPAIAGLESAWDLECKGSLALAAGRNAVVVATATELLVLDLQTGRRLATLPLPAAPVPWGVALDRQGRIIVTLENDQVRCQG